MADYENIKIIFSQHCEHRLMERFGLSFEHDTFCQLKAQIVAHFSDRSESEGKYEKICTEIMGTKADFVCRKIADDRIQMITCYAPNKNGKHLRREEKKKRKKHKRQSRVSSAVRYERGAPCFS